MMAASLSAVAILSRFPNKHNGTTSRLATNMSTPKIPKGRAGPADSTHCPTKNVQAKDTTALTIVVMTKQSVLAAPYASINWKEVSLALTSSAWRKSYVVEPDRRNLHESKPNHPKPHRQPDPRVLTWVRGTEPKHPEPSGREEERREHGRKSCLWLRKSGSLFLGVLDQKPVDDEVVRDAAEDAADCPSYSQKSDVLGPEVRRCGQDLWAHGRYCDGSAKQSSVLERNDPRSGQKERAPGCHERRDDLAAICSDAEAPGEREVWLWRCLRRNVLFSGDGISFLHVGSCFTFARDGRVAVEQSLRDEKNLADQIESQEGGCDPEDVLIPECRCDVGPNDGTDK